MKLLLDTANVADIRYFNENYPLVGVTTNPTILSREGGDIVAKLLEIRSIIGNDKQLHVQVTESTFEGMVAEAHAIVELLGENTFVKVPVSDLGLKVTKKLAEDGIGVIASISSALADMKVSISQIYTTVLKDGSVAINLHIGCKSTSHFDSIVSRLRSVKSVISVHRGFIN